ncbi:hypothetical protein Tco_1453130, partial [Tanacetum coccineum]
VMDIDRDVEPTRNTPPLPPIVKTMPGRPKKSRIKYPSEQEHEHSISRASRVMTCTKCWRTGHNKASCTNPRRDKPVTKVYKPPRPTNSLVYTTDRNRRGGININDVCPTKATLGSTNRVRGSTRRGRGQQAGVQQAEVIKTKATFAMSWENMAMTGRR